MKKYVCEFRNSEEGIETMEWIAILAVVAALIVICARVGTSVKEKLENVADNI